MMYFLDDLRNRFDFFLRNNLTFSRKNYSEKSEDLGNIFESEKDIEFCNRLENRYGNLSENSTKRVFLENLYFLNIFDKCFSKQPSEKLSVLDIGSKNWSYVKSQYLFFYSMTDKLTLDGIELDAYRLCSNFYNRYEIASFYTKNLLGTNYIAGDFMQLENNYDRIIWILPFITEYPLLRWGLPLKYFKPEEMLMHAYELLNPNGELLIINQGKNEYEVQQNLNKKLNSENITYYGEQEDRFNLFLNKRFCCKIVK